MLSAPYVTGSPNWIELGTPDVEGAKAFYGQVFDWTFVSAGPDAGGYGMFQLDGRTVAAAMTVPPEKGPPGWNVYFQTPDADAMVKAVEQRGGSVVVRPMDVFDQGRMTICLDPAGAAFAGWEPGRNKGLDRVSDVGALGWLELFTPDLAFALTYYGDVFGWEASQMPMPDGSGYYTMVRPGGAAQDTTFAGVLQMSADRLEASGGPYWLAYFGVEDCDASVARAQELGAEIKRTPVDVEGVGRFAKLADPAGARFAVVQGFTAAGATGGTRPPSGR
ncbi:VOC family protein [Streptomyces sp. Tu 2975]|uniref:VOC family protein n=1 Tax=Streptomyces sp. Tu 2975 TaxID=2676871 RepID=UPI0013572AE3|nr:VOC family protein [Streptomyces sp. Tu 2975]QIP83536.1 VOC family protein [Streptomyces sp. Tu 2975]